MNEELQRLWRLRELDEVAVAARSALSKYPGQKGSLEGRVMTEKARLAAHAKAADDLMKARRKLEQDIEAVTVQQRQFESRQPLVKTNDEFRALNLEVEVCKGRRSELETQVLVRFEEEEALARQKPLLEGALKEAESERGGRVKQIEVDEAAATARLAAIEAERQTEMLALPAATRARYERILTSREGRAVVPLNKSACGGCYRSQPPQMLQEIRRADRMLICEGCGRILILPPEDAVAG